MHYYLVLSSTMLHPGVLREGAPGTAWHEVLHAAAIGLERAEIVPHDSSRPPQERPMDEDATLDVPHVALQCDEDPPVLPSFADRLVAQPLEYTGE